MIKTAVRERVLQAISTTTDNREWKTCGIMENWYEKTFSNECMNRSIIDKSESRLHPFSVNDDNSCSRTSAACIQR